MSYANGTTHYNLPQTVGTDKRDWSDTNQAFADIDAAIYQASEDASSAGSGVTTLDNQINGVGGIDARLTTAEHDIDNVEGDISTLQGTVSGHTSQIADVRADLQDAIVAFNEPTATSTHAYAIGDYFFYNDILYKATDEIAIGDTIVPNTNCTATNVMTEVDAAASQAVTAAGVSYNNTSSGLTADDVQEAIDEINSDLPSYNNIVATSINQYDGGTDKVLEMFASIDSDNILGIQNTEDGINYIKSSDGGSNWSTIFKLSALLRNINRLDVSENSGTIEFMFSLGSNKLVSFSFDSANIYLRHSNDGGSNWTTDWTK